MNFSQLPTLLWLRWRLTRNQWRRGGELSAVLTFIAVVIGLAGGVLAGVGGVFGGAVGLAHASPLVTMFVWDGLVAGFLFIWTMGIVIELQRSETIDLTRLLHLPVSLRVVFFLNYLASHLSLTLAIMLPAMLGLAVGLVVGRGAAMALLVPAVLAFFFMVTAWTYCLRGWLASLMVNQRRRRAVVMGITVAFVLLGQLPNLVMNVWPGRNRNAAAGLEKSTPAFVDFAARAHRYVPLLWLPMGARSLAEGSAWPGVWGTAGMGVFGVLGLMRAYRSTLRFYRGGNSKQAARPAPVIPTPRSDKPLLVERTMPGVPDDVAALAFANLRSMLRAPEVKMALGMNVVIFLLIGVGLFVRHARSIPSSAHPFLATGAVLLTFWGVAQVCFNQFGFDRDGFRALVLLPTPRSHVLLGKNLSLLPLMFGIFAALITMITVFAQLRVSIIVTAVLAFGMAFFGFSMLGNLMSILTPYRIAPGTMKPTKTKATTQLVLFFSHVFTPIVMLPLFIPPGLWWLCDHYHWLPATPVMLTSAALLTAVTGVFYWQTLAPLGRLLERREQKILQTVTEEVE